MQLGTRSIPRRVSWIRRSPQLGLQLFLGFALIVASGSLSANNARFSNLWVDDGLPGKTVWGVAQDSLGFVWIGGSGGIVRYDGYELQPYFTADHGAVLPAHATVRSVIITDHDQMWVGTLGDGLYRADLYGQNGQPGISAVPTAGNSVRSLLAEPAALWAGTERGLERIDTGNADAILFPFSDGPQGKGVLFVHRWADQTLIVGHADGLALFDEVSQSFEPYMPEAFSGSSATAIASTSNGGWWVGTDRGLAHIATDSPVQISWNQTLRGSPVISIESTGDLTWVGTKRKGLYLLRGGELVEHFTHQPLRDNSLSDNAVTAIYADRSGSVWAGTFSGGLDRLNPHTLRFGMHNAWTKGLDCLPDEQIYSLLRDPTGTTLVGTGAGLVTYRPDQACARTVNWTTSVQDILQTQQGTLWIAGTSGVARITSDGPQSVAQLPVLPGFTFDLLELPSGDIAAGRVGELVTLNVEDQATSTVPFSDHARPSVYTITGPGPEYYLATNLGVYRWRPGDPAQPLLPATGAPERYAETVYFDREQTLWVGYRSLGLVRYDVQGLEMERIPTRQIGSVSAILEAEDGALWISTNNGLWRRSLDGVMRKFGAADGLQSNAFIRNASNKAADGTLMFGGRRGWNAFRSEAIIANTQPPTMAITDVSLFNQSIRDIANDRTGISGLPFEYLEQLVFNHTDDVISIHFSGLHYASPDRNRFRFQLAGFDSAWREVGSNQRQVTYTNLPWGRYQFVLHAANSDGVWSTQARTLDLIVQTPWWARWWSLLTYVTIALMILLGYGRLRAQQANRRAQRLEQEVAARTMELAENAGKIAEQKKFIETLLDKKNSLFANVSHEFRTPLTLILGPLQALIQDPRLRDVRDTHQLMHRNASRLLHLVDQLLELARNAGPQSVKPRPVNLAQLLQFVVASYRTLSNQKSIELSLSVSGEFYADLVEDALERMVGNLLSNAIKYTPEGGCVSVRLEQRNELAVIRVADNGTGLSEHERKAIFRKFTRLVRHQDEDGSGIGLALVKELAEFHGGSVCAEGNQAGGSTFVLKLPLCADTSVLVDADNSETASATKLQQRVCEGKSSVLIIEDFPDMRDYIANVLASDFDCNTASNGKAGIEIALESMPDLILSDVMMDGMDGFEVCAAVRKDERLSHIPVLLLTARSGKDSRMRGWDAFADDYMVKPFDANELRLRIHSLLEVRKKLSGEVKRVIATENQLPRQLNKCDRTFVKKVTAVVQRGFSEVGFSRADLAQAMAVSERQLQRKLKALTDQNPSEFLRDFRLRKACELLRDGEQVGLVAERCGFSSSTQFSHTFKKYCGVTPKQFQTDHIQRCRDAAV